MGEILLSPRLVADLRLTQLRNLLQGRIQPQGALAAVENNGRAVGEFHGTRLDPGQRRNTERARKNGDMRGRSAPHSRKTHDLAPLHGSGVRGREVLGDENGVGRIGGGFSLDSSEYF